MTGFTCRLNVHGDYAASTALAAECTAKRVPVSQDSDLTAGAVPPSLPRGRTPHQRIVTSTVITALDHPTCGRQNVPRTNPQTHPEQEKLPSLSPLSPSKSPIYMPMAQFRPPKLLLNQQGANGCGLPPGGSGAATHRQLRAPLAATVESIQRLPATARTYKSSGSGLPVLLAVEITPKSLCNWSLKHTVLIILSKFVLQYMMHRVVSRLMDLYCQLAVPLELISFCS